MHFGGGVEGFIDTTVSIKPWKVTGNGMGGNDMQENIRLELWAAAEDRASEHGMPALPTELL